MRRRGFSLVELLVVITIIGILAAIAVPAVMNSLRTANQFAITTEVAQLDAALETFKTRYGFYPKDFYYDHRFLPSARRGTNRIDPNLSDAALLNALRQEYGFVLRKISPQHREFIPSPQFGGQAPIVHWYRTVGRFLNPTNALAFWLNGGICESKNFPFSDRVRRPTESVSNYNNRVATLNVITLFEFKGGLEIDPFNYVDPAERTATVGSGPVNTYWPGGGFPEFLKTPMQSILPMPYAYFSDSRGSGSRLLMSYQGVMGNGSGKAKEIPWAFDGDTVTHVVNPIFDQPSSSANFSYYNKSKFQIIAAGLDQKFGEGRVGGTFASPYSWSQNEQRSWQRDDITNFSEGLLGSLEIAEERGL